MYCPASGHRCQHRFQSAQPCGLSASPGSPLVALRHFSAPANRNTSRFNTSGIKSHLMETDATEQTTHQMKLQGDGPTHHDGRLHLAVFSGITSSISQQPQLAFFRYKPTGKLSISVQHHKRQINK